MAALSWRAFARLRMSFSAQYSDMFQSLRLTRNRLYWPNDQHGRANNTGAQRRLSPSHPPKPAIRRQTPPESQ